MTRRRASSAQDTTTEAAMLGLFAALVMGAVATWNTAPPLAVEPTSLPSATGEAEAPDHPVVRPVVRVDEAGALRVTVEVDCPSRPCDPEPPGPVSLDPSDLEGLRALLRDVRHTWPHGRVAHVVPTSRAAMQSVVSVIGAVRGGEEPGEALFPEVRLVAAAE